MRADSETSPPPIDEVCASCGKAAVDEIKLKKCACDLVKYCSVGCQKNHRPQHKKACKKQLAVIRENKLFTQPDGTHLGECPICCLPLPLDGDKSMLSSCCCKFICSGCDFANKKREITQGLEQKCAYCREPVSFSQEETRQNELKRAKANDPVALCQVGARCGEEEDHEGAFKYFTKAAGLGNMDAHYNLALMYHKGEGVEKDKKKELFHLEEAAIGGHPEARFKIGLNDCQNVRHDRAAKHFIIAANLGNDDALEKLKKYFAFGGQIRQYVSKED